MRINPWFIGALGAAVLCLPARPALAQEHPEHPTGKAEVRAVSKEDLAKAITAYVEGEQAKNGGFYPIHDPVDKKDLKLVLDHVHEDKLAQTSPGEYFACADFKAADGTLYDLDFFMKGGSADDLAFNSVSIHKKEGRERYRWALEDGVWKKKPVEP